MWKTTLTCTIALLILACMPTESFAQKRGLKRQAQQQPLTRVREGGTPYDPNQRMTPYAVDLTTAARQGSPMMASPPEYDPVHGVMYKYGSGWNDIVTDMVAQLTSDPAHDEIAYVVVTSTGQQNAATTAFVNAGADMSKVEFMIQPGESIWMRDYGPHFTWREGALTIVDSHYYAGRPQDNFIPTITGDEDFGFETTDMGLYYSGGNFQPGPNRSGFVTSLVNLDNPTSEGFDATMIADLYQKFQGIDTLHVVPQLPFSVDGTGHIDMWMYMIDEDSVILSEFIPGSNSTAINVTNNTVPYMESLGFTVHRPPAWNSGSTHYTYANAYRVNDRIFVPVYGTAVRPGGFSQYNDEDADAMATWQAAAGPDIEIVPIQCADIIWASGAIHCIVMQVPRYTGSTPAASVISPTAREVFVAGETETIQWTAIDTYNADVPTIDLYYSQDDGASFIFIDSTSNTGSYDWSVPASASGPALIRIVATGSDSDATIATGEEFRIAAGTQAVYDFSTGAGSTREVFGTTTTSWSSVSGNSSPVSSELSSANYSRLATSNATGSDSDSGRYISPGPGSSGETTHIYEFTITEDAHEIDEIVMRWEGYADNCTQCELYVWDNGANQWGNGEGVTGQNHFMKSWAGNADESLTGILKGDFCNFVTPAGTIKFLVYGERRGDESFHDYASLTVKTIPGTMDSVDVTRGVIRSGDAGNLIESDNVDFSISRDSTGLIAKVNLEFAASGKCTSPSLFEFIVEDSVFARSNINRQVELLNYQTGQYEVVDSRNANRFGDTVTTVAPTGDLSRFVEPVTGNVSGRVEYSATIQRAQYTANIDEITLLVE